MISFLKSAILSLGIVLYTPTTNNLVSAEIYRIIDGDTIVVKSPDKTLNIVRLACIDAPELKQKNGYSAKGFLLSNLSTGSTVKMDIVSKDRYGREVAVLFNQNKENINSKLLDNGYAVIYQSFFHGCEKYKQEFIQSETKARIEEKGIWDDFSCFPENFRKGRC